MKDKNGFIATSILYAFLLAFLTLFLAYTANYLQNKQLLNRVQMLAQEELDKYGNKRISDIKIGDYVVFDTLEPQGDGVTHNTTYSSPVNPDAKWILFRIDEGTEGAGGEASTSRYYFVSDITGQVSSYFTGYAGSFNSGNPNTTEMTEGTQITGSLRNVEGMFEDHVHYSPSYRKYMGYASASEKTGDFMPVYYYAFPYRISNGIQVRPMSLKDIEYIKEIDSDKIKANIVDQNTSYVLWNEKDNTNGNRRDHYNYGWTIYEKVSFANGGSNNGADVSGVNNSCRDGYSGAASNSNAKNDSGYITYDNSDNSNLSIGYTSGTTYVEYCYHTKTTIGSCVSGSYSSSGVCTNPASSYYVRLVAMIDVVPEDNGSDGFVDSGNGTLQLPYLITRGFK